MPCWCTHVHYASLLHGSAAHSHMHLHPHWAARPIRQALLYTTLQLINPSETQQCPIAFLQTSASVALGTGVCQVLLFIQAGDAFEVALHTAALLTFVHVGVSWAWSAFTRRSLLCRLVQRSTSTRAPAQLAASPVGPHAAAQM